MSSQLAAGIVVVRSAPHGWLYLLLRAYRNWDFPKGMVEPGEGPLEAARREVREETLLIDLRFSWGEIYRETAPYGHNKVARYYLAQTPCEKITLAVNPELGRPEHHEWRWVEFDAALRLCPPRLLPILQWAGATVSKSLPE